MAKEYVKISFQDLEIAKDFFESDKLYFEFIGMVCEYYRGNNPSSSTKKVQKYFNSYKKTMDFVIKSRDFGKKSKEFLKKSSTYFIGNEDITNNTLIGYAEGTTRVVEYPPLTNNKEINNNINNKEIIEREREKKTKENFPQFHDNEFMGLFEQVINLDNWKNKTQQQLEFELKELKGFDKEYAKELVKHAIKMNYKSCSFPETKANYINWKKNKESKETEKAYFTPKYNKS